METIIKSSEYKKILTGGDISKLQAPPDVIEWLEIKREKAENLQRIEAATGICFDVITEGADPRMVACVDTTTKKPYVVENSLRRGNEPLVLYAAHHEAEHCSNGFFKLKLQEHLDYEEIAALKDSINEPNLTEIDLVEGFNDLITSDKHGKNMNSAYQHHEVPVAVKLEQLALETLGISLKEMFSAGNKKEFFARIKNLAQILLLKKMLSQTLPANQNAQAIAA